MDGVGNFNVRETPPTFLSLDGFKSITTRLKLDYLMGFLQSEVLLNLHKHFPLLCAKLKRKSRTETHP